MGESDREESEHFGIHCECGNDLEEFYGRSCQFCEIEYCSECIDQHERECVDQHL